MRDRFSSFFQSSQFGVACKAGAKNVFHSLRKSIENSWESGDFAIFMLPWVSWCYSIMWHPKGTISSQSGVPVLLALVFWKLVSSTEADYGCFDLSHNLWYLDDGVLTVERSAILCALHLIEGNEELGPHLGLNICDGSEVPLELSAALRNLMLYRLLPRNSRS